MAVTLEDDEPRYAQVRSSTHAVERVKGIETVTAVPRPGAEVI